MAVNPLDVREKLRAFICNELLGGRRRAVENDEPLITGGLIDSFSLARVGVFVEDEFGVYIPDTDLNVANMDTLDLMVARVMAEEAR